MKEFFSTVMKFYCCSFVLWFAQDNLVLCNVNYEDVISNLNRKRQFYDENLTYLWKLVLLGNNGSVR